MTDTQIKTIHWLCYGKTGLSSKTMALWLAFNEKLEDGRNYPHDPADFDRCLRLLDAVPELRIDLEKMKALSPYWSAFVEHWDVIEKSHLDEVGLGWSKGLSAPITYKLMDDVISGVMENIGCRVVVMGKTL